MELLPLAGAFVALLWATWRHQRRGRRTERLEDLRRNFDTDAQVALGVAHHEATRRGVPPAPAHLLYGLLQVEAFTAALARAGGEPADVEAKVLAALDAAADDPRTGVLIEAHAGLTARAQGRAATCADLWVRLARTPAAALIAPVAPHALSFLLVHGVEEPPATLPDPEVNVVVRNDDHTTMELVVEILREVFELPEADAVAKMRATHEQGKAIVGRYPRDAARTRVEAARDRARAAGAPLWVGVEPW